MLPLFRAVQKEYVDQQRNATYSSINVCDCVLVKQEKRNKLSTLFSTTPYTHTPHTEISRTGTKVTARITASQRMCLTSGKFSLVIKMIQKHKTMRVKRNPSKLKIENQLEFVSHLCDLAIRYHHKLYQNCENQYVYINSI